jgi:cytochrome P450
MGRRVSAAPRGETARVSAHAHTIRAMTVATELDLPSFDYTDPSLAGPRFHEVADALRERSWLATSPIGGFVVLDREAGEFFLRSKAVVFPLDAILEIFDIREGPLHEEMTRNVIGIEGDDHRRLRNLVNPYFTPRAAERRRPVMRAFIRELVDPLLPAGRCELVADVAQRYPALVIAELLGAPPEDAERLAGWSATIQLQFDAGALLGDRSRIERAVEELYEYLDALLAERRAHPAGDLISELLAAEAEGDRLSPVECVNLALNVLIGGVDTTQAQLAHAIRLFAEHPEQWDLLAERPELVPAAVEEALRFEPITPFAARMVREELEYRGVTFPAGTVVLVAACTANRDPGAGRDPRSFDITAERGRVRPLTFGAGTHYCLGANLARAELEEALAYMAPRMRGLRLDGEPEYDTPTGIYALRSLPVRFEPVAA